MRCSYFYPRPPRGGRLYNLHCDTEDQRISIHALREEGDPFGAAAPSTTNRFLSTPSARRATPATGETVFTLNRDFYPRPPRGGRLATCTKNTLMCCISIHALREEGDSAISVPPYTSTVFLSTPSARRATLHQRKAFSQRRYFYPRPPRGGRLLAKIIDKIVSLFLSTPSARRATYL